MRSVSSSLCPLAYPQRYEAAVLYVQRNQSQFDTEIQLLLYALDKQATNGPNKETKPWAWNQVEQAKWQAWKELGETPSIEAMRLYVRSIEQVDPNWWTAISDYYNNGSQDNNNNNNENKEAQCTQPEYNKWSQIKIKEGAKKPVVRYEMGCCIVGQNMFVIGGSAVGGKYLNDVWILNLQDYTWLNANKVESNNGSSLPNLPPPLLPPVAGHCVVSWGSNILVTGGYRKAKDRTQDLQVYVFDTTNFNWSLITPQATADVPEARGGHTSVLVGSSMYIFGGENGARRRTLGDLWSLNLETMSWKLCQPKGTPPSPRSEHVAVSYNDRYMLVFGGGSVAHCYSDLHVLDVESMEWIDVQIGGTPPAARAGHAGTVLGNMWYVVGGGNNITGCIDMIGLDLSALATSKFVKWQTIAIVEQPSSLASEGLSLLANSNGNQLISFGGYNGVYHNTVHVFKLQQTSESLQQSQESLQSQLEVNQKELEAALSQAQARQEGNEQEINLLRKQLATAQQKQAEAEQQVQQYKGQLTEQQQKIMQLEVRVAELQRIMDQQQESLKELERYQQIEENNNKSSGIWGYITGTS
eukprot:TRINITY_DN1269_c1_g2_i1.p1 TRINITY_DN1269_c1_g2~~TRINITY_DN1269_c1_g2_i1.p1  ORF type:complete len:584 (-),score=64.53 TRINITY_DN1269_c1_g2_i1:309-2060(-)